MTSGALGPDGAHSAAPSAPGGAAPADPARIERELSALWRAEAEALRRATGSEAPLSRTLLLTLLVYAPGAAAADQARQVTVALSPRQPGRTLILEAHDELGSTRPGSLDAWATLHCTRAPGGGQQVCGEQINVEASGSAVHGLAGAALPLLLPNVPCFLWWQQGNPFQMPVRHLLEDLQPAIDRLVVDSLTFESPERGLVDVERAVADPSFLPVISDLNWARLGAWRYQTAQLFDAPAVRPYLEQINSLHIQHVAGSPALAWLYGGWLASRLDWQPLGRDGEALRFEGGRTITCEAVPAEAGLEPGAFCSARLATPDGAMFSVGRQEAAWVVTRLELPHSGLQTERVMPLRDEDLATCLGHELNRLNPAPLYEAALFLLAQLLAKEER